MNMIEHLKRLFAYDDWANREAVTALEQLATPPPRSVKFLAHIVSAERLWLERLRVEKQTCEVWPDFSVAQCKLEIADLGERWKNYLASLKEEDLSRSLTYRNSQGESWSNAKQDILLHVILHSTYHRGQIATDMRAAGFNPVCSDFIHAVRQGFVE